MGLCLPPSLSFQPLLPSLQPASQPALLPSSPPPSPPPPHEGDSASSCTLTFTSWTYNTEAGTTKLQPMQHHTLRLSCLFSEWVSLYDVRCRRRGSVPHSSAGSRRTAITLPPASSGFRSAPSLLVNMEVRPLPSQTFRTFYPAALRTRPEEHQCDVNYPRQSRSGYPHRAIH
ncbi:hypothetical protein E2C01_091384 [Portunus trituberculatus]|uniref:Uncharacterized protein n=1 Tax=Portunus trituberculatus TaxID=210409 RepID=A0A5B7JIX4_PORTR|nr:hypothetical protein [Portunus trituberculatus]